MSQEVIKNLKKVNECQYPNCSDKSIINVMLPVGEITESGQITFPQESKDSSVQASCSLCDYHMIFAEKRLITLVNQNGMVVLFGPFPIVEVVEAVLEAKEFHKGMKKEIKKRKKNEKK